MPCSRCLSVRKDHCLHVFLDYDMRSAVSVSVLGGFGAQEGERERARSECGVARKQERDQKSSRL